MNYSTGMNNYYGAMNGAAFGPYTPATGGASFGTTGNSFLRAAEESSRNAFQSIESVVQAFSAVSAMFESTYYAVFNSFRAVVGVADQFYRLKNHLTRILSALAIFRFLKYLARRLLRLLRLGNNGNNNNEDSSFASASSRLASDAWGLAMNDDTEKLIYDKSRRQTNWPLIMFFAVVVGGPWLIWRILSSIESLNKDDRLWMQGKIDHFVAVAEYDFDAENNDELSFRRGQRIILAPKEYQPKLRGWLLGTLDGSTQGIIPANYVRIMGKKLGESASNESLNNK